MLRPRVPATLRCGNQVIDLSTPVIMGIINATPDSFYAPSRTENNLDFAVEMAGKGLAEGAAILDIGGMSSRPGADEIDETEELQRVLPVIAAIHDRYPEAILSVDTWRSTVAMACVKAGATIINDISGGQRDPNILKVAADLGATFVIMHMRGTPKDMQQYTDYENVISDVIKYFIHQIRLCHSSGIQELILDPGFGFSKTPTQNYRLIQTLQQFTLLEYPVLVGVSRKSTLSKTIGRPVEETLEATTALHMAALLNGASILRVHDVRAAKDAIAVFNQLNANDAGNNKRLGPSA